MSMTTRKMLKTILRKKREVGSNVVLHEQVRKLRVNDDDLLQEAELRAGYDGTEGRATTTSTGRRSNEDDPATKPRPFRFVPLRMGGNGRTHVPTAASADLLEEIGGIPTLRNMTERFYDKAFRDETLDKFIRSHGDPHGERFAAWIHQKLGGPGRSWDANRASRSDEEVTLAHGHRVRVHDRTSAHVAAWYSPKRPDDEVGRHFKLDECRVWMRLHFWAMREAGLPELSPSFTDFYVRFIGHFVRVYEGTAPAFARESYRWSEKQENIDAFLQNKYRMIDVLGLSLREALKQIPKNEAKDLHWPYIESMDDIENQP